MPRFYVCASIAIALMFVAGCGKQSVSDDTVANDLKAKLFSDQATKSANINVGVKDGVVTLTGDVPTSDVELAAVKAANGTPGVKSVNDQLKVNASSAMTPLPPAGTAETSNSQTPPLTGTSTGPAAPPPGEAASASKAPPSEAVPPPSNPYTGAAPKGAPQPVAETIPAGTALSVRTIDTIDSARNDSGEVFRASLNTPILVRGRTVVPKGEPVSLLLTNAQGAGRIKGRAELEVRAVRLQYHGQSYDLNTTTIEETGKARGKSTAERGAIGAAAGAIIGAIAGGGKGAAIGSMAGGGAGVGVNVFTHGQQVKIPSESVLTFRLQSPVSIRETR
ncbi:MAG: BON domain-containing protein [Acidobacteriaceae bacterium]|nr:BON domain-containing protein [Acidobacteriaceae bacterium]